MVAIFIEDKKDGKESKFLRTIIKILFHGNYSDITIDTSNGYTNLKKLEIQFNKNSDLYITNLVLFDADTPENNGGFDNRKRELENIRKEINVNFELFLFPNNKDDGEFETLPQNIINPTHNCLLECFERYEECISQFKNEINKNKYSIPDKKDKMYSYIDALFFSQNDKEKMKNKLDWSFENPEYWDLNNPYLEPLKLFLSNNIKL